MASSKPQPGKSLAETHPELTALADGWDPATVTSGSGKKMPWKCELGHQWVAQVASRVYGRGCPICSNKKVLVGYNDLATTNPELANEADGWDPATLIAGSGKKVEWKCGLSHRWDAKVVDRANGSGCPVCVNKNVLVGFNDLATTNPELAKEADGWDPATVTSGSGKKMPWKCELGHLWVVAVNARKENGCPVCANKQVLVGYNDLATTNPELSKEAEGWDPKTVTSWSGKKMPWKCELGHQWVAQVASRAYGIGCPICSNQRVLVGYNDLATTNPELSKEADGWDPKTVTHKSGSVRSWRCKFGHQWKANIATRSNGHNCPYCANKQVLVGFNDLATTNPELAKEADGWDPTTITQGSGLRKQWKCDNGHRWLAGVANRTKGDLCPICSNQKVLVGYNDLATTNPELAEQADGWDPTSLVAGSGRKRKWRCEKGHVWVASLANRQNLGTGCPSCAKTGFDPNQPGFLYFIDHFDLHMFQIGITNFPDDRLGDHKRRGWEVIELRGPMDGHLTQKLETDCLQALEKRGAILGHKAGIEKFDGYTEAWTKKSLNVTSIKQILDWVYEDETQQKVRGHIS